MSLAAFDSEARKLVDAEIARLQSLSFAAARELPESDGRDIRIGDQPASLTVFRYVSPFELEGRVLVVVLAALPRLFGMAARHVERGLVFLQELPPREATQTELENSGG
jgi:hypothetical protein